MQEVISGKHSGSWE